MNELFIGLGILRWKGLVGSLLLPPLPFLLLALYGGWRLPRRPALGRTALLLALLGIWASCSSAVGWTLIDLLNRPPPPLDAAQRERLAGAPRTAIVVLGAGRRLQAPEFASADFNPMTLERLRYGLWLARQTRLPVLFSGGIGHGSLAGPTEAEIARRVAERDFGWPLRWTEDRSRDTNENAQQSVALLHAAGIDRVVLVTHGFHQRRALAAFVRAAAHDGVTMEIVAAPMGLRSPGPWQFGDWLPTAEGLLATRLALHEWLGRLAGA